MSELVLKGIFFIGASSRNRTGTINDREILSLLRLPIPPWTQTLEAVALRTAFFA